MKRAFMKSPAKINLGLNILNKREDGFHNIETISYQIQLCDNITFEKNEETFSFTANSEALTSDIEGNLIIKALRLVEAHIGKKLSLQIDLQKNIPIGAGLGGGSSNAAITLIALNELFSLEMNDATLDAFAAKLGSDVNMFLKHFSSYATGRGEVVRQINIDMPYTILLINPGIHVSTPWAYKNCVPSVPEVPLEYFIINNTISIKSVLPFLKNDFENNVFAAFPEIRNIKNSLLEQGAVFAQMSGSGSSVFGLFDSSVDAERTMESFPEEYFSYIEFPE